MDSLSSEEIAARLSGSPEERAALVRAGAEAGVAEAQAVLGQMLLDDGQAREGFAWFNKAAGQGHPMALNMVGRCYDLGWGTAIDKVRAAECFRIAAERGLEWGMYNYATSLTLGEGLTEDKAAALAWFNKAAAMGNAKAINYVGSFHEDGWVVARDMVKAADFYRQAAEGGDFRGAFNHARMLLEAGQVEAARGWLARCRETATPAFVQKARDWLKASSWPELDAALC
ncbi:tetratricopeptide repeat protein [Sphingomonas sp. R-74633]|uniref:tetratricopeptide repeat protein n=1 Tax=Sphingomonas sp. R-74633 TaxID=2751188 RepID=UPI00211DDE6C|nr:tetratricopeptide repeat protein [Sphingomonas sp. R-74633]